MYIVNIKIPDNLKGKVKIDFPEPFKIKESKETPLKLKKQRIFLLKINQ